MKETNYLISLQHLPFIHLCHSDLFPRKNELKVNGHMSDPNSTSPDILSDGPGKYILRPVTALKLICFTLQVYTSKLIILVKLSQW